MDGPCVTSIALTARKFWECSLCCRLWRQHSASPQTLPGKFWHHLSPSLRLRLSSYSGQTGDSIVIGYVLYRRKCKPLGGSRQFEKVPSEVSSIPVPTLELIYRPNGWLASLAEKITFEALMYTEILIHWYWKSVENCARGSTAKVGNGSADYIGEST